MTVLDGRCKNAFSSYETRQFNEQKNVQKKIGWDNWKSFISCNVVWLCLNRLRSRYSTQSNRTKLFGLHNLRNDCRCMCRRKRQKNLSNIIIVIKSSSLDSVIHRIASYSIVHRLPPCRRTWTNQLRHLVHASMCRWVRRIHVIIYWIIVSNVIYMQRTRTSEANERTKATT